MWKTWCRYQPTVQSRLPCDVLSETCSSAASAMQFPLSLQWLSRNVAKRSWVVTLAWTDALIKGCPSCRADRGYNETMLLHGLDDFLAQIAKVVQTEDELDNEEFPEIILNWFNCFFTLLLNNYGCWVTIIILFLNWGVDWAQLCQSRIPSMVWWSCHYSKGGP